MGASQPALSKDFSQTHLWTAGDAGEVAVAGAGPPHAAVHVWVLLLMREVLPGTAAAAVEPLLSSQGCDREGAGVQT